MDSLSKGENMLRAGRIREGDKETISQLRLSVNQAARLADKKQSLYSWVSV